MHVLITGTAGLLGAGSAGRPARDGVLAGRPLGALTRADLSAPEAPEGFAGRVTRLDLDLAAPDAAARLVEGRPEVIFHLAAIVPGEAEADRTKGWATNLDATRAGLEDGQGVRR